MTAYGRVFVAARVTVAVVAVTALAGCGTTGTAGGSTGAPSPSAPVAGNVIRDPEARVSDWSLAVSPDGTRVAAPCSSGLCVWDTASGKLATTLTGRTAVAWSPDGTLLATEGPSPGQGSAVTVRLLSATDGRVVRDLVGHQAPDTTDARLGLTALSFSRDGSVLASAAHDGTVRLWSVGDGAAMQVLTVGAARPTAVAFSPDGSRLAVASVQAPVSVWDVKTGAKTATLSSSPPQSYGVAFSADGLRLATATRDPEHVVRVVDAVTGEVRATFPGTPAAHAVAFRPGADVVAFTDPVARVVVVWPVSAGAARTLTGHTDGPHALAFSPDGKALYSASARDGILRWDADTATLVARFERPPAG